MIEMDHGNLQEPDLEGRKAQRGAMRKDGVVGTARPGLPSRQRGAGGRGRAAGASAGAERGRRGRGEGEERGGLDGPVESEWTTRALAGATASSRRASLMPDPATLARAVHGRCAVLSGPASIAPSTPRAGERCSPENASARRRFIYSPSLPQNPAVPDSRYSDLGTPQHLRSVIESDSIVPSDHATYLLSDPRWTQHPPLRLLVHDPSRKYAPYRPNRLPSPLDPPLRPATPRPRP
ncbi:hypothetical protein C8Q78DRAFT_40849 [Trametes maxima]|nr:hypothetical protein C8Q78DRAFT_40849 [Trametes maxima]